MELLVALALLSVVMLMAGLLLNSLQINTQALLEGFAEDDPGLAARLLDEDLRMLLRGQPDAEAPVLGLNEEGELSWRRLEVDGAGRERPVGLLVKHDPEARAVIRIRQSGAGVNTTNVVWRGVSGLDWRFWDGDAWRETWPPGEQKDVLPRLVRAELRLEAREAPVVHDMPVPAAMRFSPENP